jgi:pyruvate dehydrogenase E2 component (dihydrolipoamide acetyltransferase)
LAGDEAKAVAEFRMPSLGADMEAGTLVEWLVKPGDWVKRGDIVAVVETQKGAIEIEIYQPGQIEKFLVDLQSKVPVGTPLALIRSESEAKAVAAPPPLAPVAAPMPAPSVMPPLAPQPAAGPMPPPAPLPRAAPMPPPAAAGMAGRKTAWPAARRLAEERGIDLSAIAGSGPGGSITSTDVERYLAAAPAPAERKRAAWLEPAAMRAASAAAMARSKREIPHYYLEHQIDVTPCERWLAEKNAALPPASRLLIGALALKAVALALPRFPAFNGFYRDNKFEPSKAVHVGWPLRSAAAAWRRRRCTMQISSRLTI